jgi:hypothetical protein
MIGIVVASSLFAVIRLAKELSYWTIQNGWNTSVLARGDHFIVCSDVRLGESTVPAGT